MAKPFFWLHIKKAAGMSFRKAFTPPYVETDRSDAGTLPFIALPKEAYNDALNNFRIPLGAYDYKRTLFAEKFLYQPNEFEQMYKFCIVRNPYRRIFSAWRYLMHYEIEVLGHHAGNARYEKMRKDFTYFLQCMPEFRETKLNRHLATHTAPIWGDISDERDKLLLDDFYPVETLDQRSSELCEKLDISPRNFSKENSGTSRPQAKGFIRKTDPYRSAMGNGKTLQLIEEQYKDDLTHLGYSGPFDDLM